MREQDLDKVSDLMMRNFDEIMKEHHSREIIEKFKSHNSCENLKQQMIWKEILVVEEHDEIIATGSVANFGDESNPQYSISNFFVKPELQRTGIGKALFIDLHRIAIVKGAQELHVPSSRNAIKFYEKMGFMKDAIQHDEADEITWMSMRIEKL